MPTTRPLLLLLLLLALTTACSDDATGPTADPDAVTAVIGTAGGSLALNDEAEITVPAGALAADTELTLRRLSGADVPDQLSDADVAYALEPESVVFSVPVDFELTQATPGKMVASEHGLAFVVIPSTSADGTRTMVSSTIDATSATERIIRGSLGDPGVMGVVSADGATVSVTVSDETVPCDTEFEVLLRADRLGSTLLEADVTWTDRTELLTPNNLAYADGFQTQADLGRLTGQEPAATVNHGRYVCVQPPTAPRTRLTGGFTFSDIELVSMRTPEGTTLELIVSLDLQCETCEQTGTGDFRGVAATDLVLPEALLVLRAGFAALAATGFLLILAAGGNGWGIFHGSTGAALLAAYLVADVTLWGITPLSATSRLKDGQTAYHDAVVDFGPNGAGITRYIAGGEDPGFGWTQLIEFQQPVYDVVTFGNAQTSSGALFVRGADVRFIDWNADLSFFEVQQGYELTSAMWPGRTGTFISAFTYGLDEPVLALETGSPGQVWLHARDGSPAAVVGAVGDDPRRVRADGGIAAVSNYGGDSLTILTWDGGATAAVAGTVSVGDGPVGIDVMDLGDGTVGIVSTGYLDDTYTVTVVSAADGSVVSNVTSPAPETCDAPGHAVWVRDGTRRIAFSCNGNGAVATLDSGL